MSERSELIAWIRGELVGPSRAVKDPTIIEFHGTDFLDSSAQRRGPLGWRPAADSEIEEVLYYDSETPHRKYGAGLLHPVEASHVASTPPDIAAAEATDTLGIDPQENEVTEDSAADDLDEAADEDAAGAVDTSDDFEVTSPDVRHPSTIGISLCVRLSADGQVIVRLPQRRRFSWQTEENGAFPVNGRYEQCTRHWIDDQGRSQVAPMWRRRPAVPANTEIIINRTELVTGQAAGFIGHISQPVAPESDLLSFRRAEFNVIRNEVNDPERIPNLRVIPSEVSDDVAPWFSKVNPVERLRETRVFYGFDRLDPNPQPLAGMPDAAMIQLFWHPPQQPQERWLPAVETFGESIYLSAFPRGSFRPSGQSHDRGPMTAS